MEIDTSFGMREYYGNCGLTVDGYDCSEIDYYITTDLTRYFEELAKDNPEPSHDDSLAYEYWLDDMNFSLQEYFDYQMDGGKYADIIEKYHLS